MAIEKPKKETNTKNTYSNKRKPGKKKTKLVAKTTGSKAS